MAIPNLAFARFEGLRVARDENLIGGLTPAAFGIVALPGEMGCALIYAERVFAIFAAKVGRRGTERGARDQRDGRREF
jgi:hypothetical protein